MRILRNSVYMGLVAVFFITAVMGCASSRKTTTTETTNVQHPNSEASQVEEKPTALVSTTTSTTTETKPQHTGIIGGLFHIIGTIIAFPFVVIGNVLQAIF